MRAQNALLRTDSRARDEYLLRVELHARLASEPDLFSRAEDPKPGCRVADQNFESLGSGRATGQPIQRGGTRWAPVLALAA